MDSYSVEIPDWLHIRLARLVFFFPCEPADEPGQQESHRKRWYCLVKVVGVLFEYDNPRNAGQKAAEHAGDDTLTRNFLVIQNAQQRRPKRGAEPGPGE